MLRTHLAAILLAVATAAPTTWGQTRPEPPAPLGRGPTVPVDAQAPQSPQAPRVSSPYWNGSDLPAADIRAVPAARATAVQARWEFHQSMVDLSNAVRLVQMQMETRPEFVSALVEEQNAYNAMEAARRQALAPLRDNAAYTASLDLHQNTSQQIEDEAYQDRPDQARIDALARLRLDYMRDTRKLERAVLDDDQPYLSARQRYMEAGARVRQLRQEQAMRVLEDPDLQALRRAVAENRIHRLASAAYARETVRARNIALNYASYYQSYDRRPYYTAGYWHSHYGKYGYRY